MRAYKEFELPLYASRIARHSISVIAMRASPKLKAHPLISPLTATTSNGPFYGDYSSMSAPKDIDNEPLVLPPLSAAIVVRCLEQDEWLVKIGVGLLDAFLVGLVAASLVKTNHKIQFDYISANHPNSDVAAVYRRLKSDALLASLLDSLGVSEIQTSKRKQRALHALVAHLPASPPLRQQTVSLARFTANCHTID